jgi:hypothetical protein
MMSIHVIFQAFLGFVTFDAVWTLEFVPFGIWVLSISR